MIKRTIFSIILMVFAFGCIGIAGNITHIRFELKVNTPFLLEAKSKMALPAGDYLV